ncbi:hypothetical protein HK097_000943 [Rhizophlyctis rosea]|uniref:Uncharacterized protein n=1 Tax=Rhizophlyctis rosea TaxID=64517 RepID=A0AAD5S7I3_9FUNG|nr:hypothetical protein HK097_000943 [Rhizophlyctis rosea]
MMGAPPQGPPPRVVVGIDFGTTFSGYAHAHCSGVTDKKVYSFFKWPASPGGVPWSKTSSVSLYEGTNLKAWGFPATREFARIDGGGEGTAAAEIHFGRVGQFTLCTRFKLHLDESCESRPPLPPGMDEVTVIGDYLHALHSFMMPELRQIYGQNLMPEELKYCLTIPAMWTDLAKHKMRQAALRAGLIPTLESDRLTLIPEPEAAAFFALDGADRLDLAVGERFMIVDAGGGTVDLTVHELLNDRKMRECSIGSGDTCGSSIVDEEFYAYLKERLGPNTMNNITNAGKNLYTYFHNDWIAAKHEFDGTAAVDPLKMHLAIYRLLDPSEHSQDLSAIDIPPADMRQMFDPAVNRTLELIDAQLQACQANGKPVDRLILVGGFCSSPYLKRRIHETFATRVRYISTVAEPSAAVVNGAVLCGLRPSGNAGRITRLSYGIEAVVVKTKRSFLRTKKEKLPKGFIPFILQGTPVGPDDFVERRGFRVPSPQSERLAINIFCVPRKNAEFVTEQGFKMMGTIVVDVSSTVGHPEREILCRMFFGKEEIKVVAIDMNTGREYHCQIQFAV